MNAAVEAWCGIMRLRPYLPLAVWRSRQPAAFGRETTASRPADIQVLQPLKRMHGEQQREVVKIYRTIKLTDSKHAPPHLSSLHKCPISFGLLLFYKIVTLVLQPDLMKFVSIAHVEQ